MTFLGSLAAKYGTDKVGWYTPFYHTLFYSRREEFRKVLEVGIGTPKAMGHVSGYIPGASLRMWRDYFPNAEIYGVDSDPSAMVWETKIKSFLSDSQNITLPGVLGKDFDVAIDDGDHAPKSQWETFENLYPVVRPGGFYIIEDAENWAVLSDLLGERPHQIVLCPQKEGMGKLILIRK